VRHPDTRPRLLLIDDNARFVENLEEILEGEGYDVRTAGTCAQARSVSDSGFDVALLDLKLPDGDGTGLAAELKTKNPEGEIVLLTGFGTVESAAAAVRAGACAYLLKPCATPELLLTVEQAMRQVRLKHDKRDLSRRAQVAEKLAAVGTMTAGLSHEIRNPLNAAALQLQVLERRIRKLEQPSQPLLLEPLGLVRDEIRRLDQLLEDFLQLARPREFNPRPVPPGPLLGRIIDFMQEDAERRGITLERELGDVRPIRGDEERLRQVLMNLALNALDAAPRGGTVRMSALPDPRGDVVILVEDTGVGIPEEVAQRIFEPFYTTKPSGSGLGLPIVHQIVTQHGGTIEVKRSTLGGARFELRLPAML
jgi:two-component system, NtrC family, sensor histidine kinase HydH